MEKVIIEKKIPCAIDNDKSSEVVCVFRALVLVCANCALGTSDFDKIS
jgi:hypothetical protein